MPSAHGPVFCRKELWEKVGAKIRFFLGLSQRTRPIFFSDQKSAHTDRFFIGAIVCDNNRRGPIVGLSQRTRTDFLS